MRPPVEAARLGLVLGLLIIVGTVAWEEGRASVPPPRIQARVEPANLTWTQATGVPRPAARAEHTMVYDSASDRVLLFGGYTSEPNGETWAYDVKTETWTNMTSGVAPPARTLAAMAYDSKADRTILFSGYHQGAQLNDTWAYDFNTNTWTDLNPASAPTGRTGHAMAYDFESDRIILFGGFTAEPVGETWAFDLGRNNWTLMSPASAPSPRGLHSLAYDRAADRVILFGGSIEGPGSGITFYRETWTYDFNGDAWRRTSPANAPSARAWSAMAYDDALNQSVLFGGLDASGTDGDTWLYDAGKDAWSEATPIKSPAGRSGHALAYDTASDRAVLFGGRTLGGPSAETWALGPAPPDTTPPVVLISSPTDGAVLGSTTLVVRGTASDDRGLARLDVRSEATDWVLASGTATWAAVIGLAGGQNTVQVRATDTSGNTAFATITVTALPLSTFLLVATAVGLPLLAAWIAWRVIQARRRDPLWRFRRP